MGLVWGRCGVLCVGIVEVGGLTKGRCGVSVGSVWSVVCGDSGSGWVDERSVWG